VCVVSSPQSSVSARSSDRDLYRRMRRRHQEDLAFLASHSPSSSLGSLDLLAPKPPIDPALFGLLNDPQRRALRQRSLLLAQVLLSLLLLVFFFVLYRRCLACRFSLTLLLLFFLPGSLSVA
jgi:hypothetical protein